MASSSRSDRATRRAQSRIIQQLGEQQMENIRRENQNQDQNPGPDEMEMLGHQQSQTLLRRNRQSVPEPEQEPEWAFEYRDERQGRGKQPTPVDWAIMWVMAVSVMVFLVISLLRGGGSMLPSDSSSSSRKPQQTVTNTDTDTDTAGDSWAMDPPKMQVPWGMLSAQEKLGWVLSQEATVCRMVQEQQQHHHHHLCDLLSVLGLEIPFGEELSGQDLGAWEDVAVQFASDTDELNDRRMEASSGQDNKQKKTDTALALAVRALAVDRVPRREYMKVLAKRAMMMRAHHHHHHHSQADDDDC